MGFHGTNNDLTQQILSQGLQPSIGDKEWIGDGVYFFIDGLSKDPRGQAKKWAIISAWDNNLKTNKYNTFAVLESMIKVDDDNLLNLNTADGVEILEFLKDQCENKLKKKKLDFIDGYLINYARGENILTIDACITNTYIKLEKRDRINNFKTRSSNCTICSVYNPSVNIIKTTKIEEGGF